MKIKQHVIFAGVSALILLGVIGSLVNFIPAGAQGIPRQVQVDSQVLESLQGGGTADFVILMAGQADLSAAYGITDWNERGWYVYTTLKETAIRTQRRTIAQLQRHGLSYISFFAANAIYVRGGTLPALNAALDVGDAASVRAPVTVQLEPAVLLPNQTYRFEPQEAEPQAEMEAAVPTWGLEDTNAPDFWTAYRRHGEGIIVANIDSGVQYDHPALADAYRCAGSGLPVAACWHDATSSIPGTIPYDDHGHGTHTMGTMVGTQVTNYWVYPNRAEIIGMAPAAKWIACKAFYADGNASDIELNSCADWLIAPNGDPANRPHIINNSWSDEIHDTWFEPAVNAWAAAGIFPVFSAGNSGSTVSCSNIYSPGDYLKSFTVGAHDSFHQIASFSSKGPNYIGTEPYLKPNISAPGVNILSARPIDYSYPMHGTSMAAPHVSGAVALLWSCNPGLRGQFQATVELLHNSAASSPPGDCGAPLEGGGNYTYGHGFLDVYAAGAGTCLNWQQTYLPVVGR